jgi:mono/diheme cytochrome c family protein
VASRRALFLALAGAALLGTGCNARTVDYKGADLNEGRTLFVMKCGGCHALADAATAGTVGPNLDNAFAGARSNGFDESTFFQITLDQMRLAAPPMPHFDKEPQKLSEEQLVDVAAYVASVAGKPVEQPGQQASGATGAGTTTAP